jgi:hypothetical protein
LFAQEVGSERSVVTALRLVALEQPEAWQEALLLGSPERPEVGLAAPRLAGPERPEAEPAAPPPATAVLEAELLALRPVPREKFARSEATQYSRGK